MATRYTVIQKDEIKVRNNLDVREVLFNAPSVNPDVPAVLMFVLHPNISSDLNLGLLLKVNNTIVLNEKFSDELPRSLHVVVEPDIIEENDNRLEITFKDTDDTGSLTLSEIVVMYEGS